MEQFEPNESKRRVYVETSVIGYLANRRSHDTITAARQEITQAWWPVALVEFELFVSPVVLDEAGSGDTNAARDRLSIVEGIPSLDVNENAQKLAAALISEKAIPQAYPEDALHIALATVHGMDFLVTWNFAHINNAVLRSKVEEVNHTGLAGDSIS